MDIKIDDMVECLSKKYSLDCVDGVFEIIIRDRQEWDDDESDFNKVFPHDGSPKEVLTFLLRKAYENVNLDKKQ